MRFELRISKYDPTVRYTDATTWTSISDVDRKFDDGVLSLVEYQRVEQVYLDAVEALLADAGNPPLQITKFEYSGDAAAAAGWTRAGALVEGSDVLEICRFELREELSCFLVSDGFSVSVGFDYYMYVEGEAFQSSTLAGIEESGLFIEPHRPSPYRAA